jgi:hypothetical protein
MNAREEELVAGALLADPDATLECFHQKRWAELAALVRFVRRDVPVELAQTDPALYRALRDQVTRFFLRGGDAFCLERIEALASGQAEAKKEGPF